MLIIKKASTQEGFVVEFEDGERYKFKSPEYLKIHKLISNISLKSVAEVYVSGRLGEYKKDIPDEFLDEVNKYESEIKENLDKTIAKCIDCFIKAPKQKRKDFALFVKKYDGSLQSYMFPLLDAKPIQEVIDKFFKKEYGINLNR